MSIEQTTPTVAGLTYIPGYLSPAAQTDLLAAVDSAPWRTDLSRRVQHYGWRYDYKRRTVDESMYLGPLPPWADALAERLHAEGHTPARPDQCIVNEYQPGQGISAHVDCVPCFGAVILSLTLGSACEMIFRQVDGPQTASLILTPGSLLVMGRAARYEWTHAIPARKSDVIGGRRVKRGRRVSLTFRTVILSE